MRVVSPLFVAVLVGGCDSQISARVHLTSSQGRLDPDTLVGSMMSSRGVSLGAVGPDQFRPDGDGFLFWPGVTGLDTDDVLHVQVWSDLDGDELAAIDARETSPLPTPDPLDPSGSVDVTPWRSALRVEDFDVVLAPEVAAEP